MKTTIVLLGIFFASACIAHPATDPRILAWVDSVSNANKIESLQQKVRDLEGAKVSKHGDMTVISGMPHTLVLPFSEQERKAMLAKARADLASALIERKKLRAH